MSKPSIATKAVSIILALTFMCSQVYADASKLSADKLAASLVTDSKINPARSDSVQNDIAEKAEPGAIGNGLPLIELAQGKLPQRVDLAGIEHEEIARKLSEAIGLAINLSVANENRVPLLHKARAREALDNLISLQANLSKKAYLYKAIVIGPENYLLGFNYMDNHGFSIEIIDLLYRISPKRLAQYIYHECVPEKGVITERDDHRAIYNDIQTAIFGQDEVLALKLDLRRFIRSAQPANSQYEWKMGSDMIGSFLLFLEDWQDRVGPDAEFEVLKNKDQRQAFTVKAQTGKEYWEIRSLFGNRNKYRHNGYLGETPLILLQFEDTRYRTVSNWSDTGEDATIGDTKEDIAILKMAEVDGERAMALGKGLSAYDKKLSRGADEKVLILKSDRIEIGFVGENGAYHKTAGLEAAGYLKAIRLDKDTRRLVLVFTEEAKRFLEANNYHSPKLVDFVSEQDVADPIPTRYSKDSLIPALSKESLGFKYGNYTKALESYVEYCTKDLASRLPNTFMLKDLREMLADILDHDPKISNLESDLHIKTWLTEEDIETIKSTPSILVAKYALWMMGYKDYLDRDPSPKGSTVSFTNEGFQEIKDKFIAELAGINDVTLLYRLKALLLMSEYGTKYREQYIGDINKRLDALKDEGQGSAVTLPAVTTQISEDLPVRAKIFAANLKRILADHPDQLFFIGIENDIGESQKAQIMPIYKAIDEIKGLKDAGGNPLFPNLMLKRDSAEKLAQMVLDLNNEGKLRINNAFIGARELSVDNKLYDSIKGERGAWISAIDDSRPGDYIPVFEAITLNMMSYLNADLAAIKNFYDAISDKPIDPAVLQDMIRNRTIFILPRATKFDTKQLRELYELAQQVYIAA